jgi:ribonuclease HI
MSIEERKFSFCPTISGFDINNLIVECPKCTRFFAACCSDNSFGGDMYDSEKPLCHHYQIVFTDGACSNNGQGDEAKAGLGVVISDVDLFWSVAVDDTVDTAPRTNQRAELLAAIEGLKKLELVFKYCTEGLEDKENHSKSAARRRRAIAEEDFRDTFIVVTDSEYVVKGITEWFPAWRVSCHSG